MWIKSIQTVGFNGAHTVCTTTFKGWYKINLVSEKHLSHMLHVTTNSRQNIKFWLQTLFVTCHQIQQPILNLRILNFHDLFFWIIWKMSKKSLKIRIGIYIWWTRYYAVQELINVLPKLVRDCMLISASRYVKVHVHILYFYCSHPTTRIGTSFMEIFK